MNEGHVPSTAPRLMSWHSRTAQLRDHTWVVLVKVLPLHSGLVPGAWHPESRVGEIGLGEESTVGPGSESTPLE